ncbi:MAG: FtsX-like permease family protein, partial [Bacteroides sp.]|nr:FtsX-like permease family protein [Bacteroides sp.]
MKRLVALPFTTSFSIAYKSIRVRFFRALITTMSLVLAVAFLSFTQVNTDIAEGILATGSHDHIQQLSKLGYDITPGDTSISASAKQRWIILLSLLVCVVGIVNAQLMSVSERFREIGTMKCLGALDNFIIRIFILEAAIQGLVGSLAGALLGMGAALFINLIRFG